MTTAVIIVLLIRLLVPLTIFKYRISGAVASIVVDALDVVVVEALQSLFGEPRVGFGDYYQAFDKWLDCLLYTSPSPRDGLLSRMPSSA